MPPALTEDPPCSCSLSCYSPMRRPLLLPLAPFPLDLTNNKPFVAGDRQRFGAAVVHPRHRQQREFDPRARMRRPAELAHSAETKADVGAGRAPTSAFPRRRAGTLGALGETLTVAQPPVLTLGHVARVEGRRVDGLLGTDFLSRHVVELDYAREEDHASRPRGVRAAPGAAVVPLNLETGWPIVEGTITPRGGKPIPCRLIIDTGVRGTVTLFQPFSTSHRLHELTRQPARRRHRRWSGRRHARRRDRLDALSLGSLSFAQPVAMFSRDTGGIFSLDYPEGIVGGELLRRHRVTFDYPHERMILEPYSARRRPFEYDMSGLFLAAEARTTRRSGSSRSTRRRPPRKPGSRPTTRSSRSTASARRG